MYFLFFLFPFSECLRHFFLYVFAFSLDIYLFPVCFFFSLLSFLFIELVVELCMYNIFFCAPHTKFLHWVHRTSRAKWKKIELIFKHTNFQTYQWAFFRCIFSYSMNHSALKILQMILQLVTKIALQMEWNDKQKTNNNRRR